jgi:N-methylhydantoinase A/oxoprolinase/acetone carboxylase beta subunit
MDLLALNVHEHDLVLGDDEARLVESLRARPRSAAELARLTNAVGWQFLPLARLEESHLVQRCALTPTDLLHVTAQVTLWDAPAARRMCDAFARLAGSRREEFAQRAIRQVVRMLAVELLKKRLDDRIDGDDLDASPAARALIDNALGGGDDGFRVRVALGRPIVGIGAPVHCFLPEAARLLETEAIIPPHADVANAIGAITSSVCVRKHVRIVPNDYGNYSLYGLPDAPAFQSFQEAHAFAVEALVRAVRQAARQAGTSETTVEVIANDRVAAVADGGQVFIGRTLEGRLTGRPDVARFASAP